MAFYPVPKESKNRIDKAGQALVNNPKLIGGDRDLVDRWRACHAYPLNTFNSTLREKIRKFPQNPIVAQRLKRMSTIIDKLKRYPQMKLTRMQDIGGIRAVMESVEEVYKLAKEYKDKSRFTHELVIEKDYIQKPRDEDGYRSLHLVYKYQNRLAPSYLGLLIELQIRTRLQHIWATAVETMGTFLGQALKSRQGEKEWLDFFAIVSSAFAYMENTSRVPKFKHISKIDTFRKVAAANKELQVLEKIKGYSVGVNEILKRGRTQQGWFYHLIILNSLQKSVQIKIYKRESFKQAIEDFAKIEERVAQGEKIEPVLVSAGPLDVIRKAYPNFFLDISDFVKKVEEIIQTTNKVI